MPSMLAIENHDRDFVELLMRGDGDLGGVDSLEEAIAHQDHSFGNECDVSAIGCVNAGRTDGITSDL